MKVTDEMVEAAIREWMRHTGVKAVPFTMRPTLEAALAEPETCTWQQDGDSDSSVYGTSCGHYFDITDGTPEDNKMKWCCYCGRKLTQALITEDEDD